MPVARTDEVYLRERDKAYLPWNCKLYDTCMFDCWHFFRGSKHDVEPELPMKEIVQVSDRTNTHAMRSDAGFN